jgi:hypothetical protein
MDAIAGGLPLRRIADAVARAVDLTVKDAPVPAVGLLPGRVIAWDAPGMRIGEYIALYRACMPGGSLTDGDLRRKFRAGDRYYPITGRFRRVPGLAIPRGRPLPGERRARKASRRQKRARGRR